MKAKSAIPYLIATVMGLGLSSCGVIPGTSAVTVEPGYTGLKIQLYGGNKGIENAEVVTGRVWYNGYTEQVVIFPTFINTYPFTQTSTEGSPVDESVVFSVGGSPVSADVGVSFGFTTEALPNSNTTKLHEFYRVYRKSPDQFRANELRNGLRNCFGEAAEDLELTPSMLPTNQQRLVAEVTECVQGKFPTIVVQDVSLLSPLRLPPEIQASIDEQFAAQQAAQTAEANRRKVEAEAAANVARARGEAQVTIEQARAEAEANRLRAVSITPQLIELERLRVERARIERWDGQQAPTIQTPNVQLGGSVNQTPAPAQ
ncbi:membrane protease subunit, stomatin/prohibitin [Oscillatoria sp. FACHB-1407]|uniref:SPFH domain-containing protein n=1 Tax=Oscillatoria sp. FACHB-1407 TaxID=2692847 RepID=UPI0016857B43|nr:SPFH domain-containing protein [Oscillatoria sp. FACHB-1407]MBD2464869.1 membrane protease subunit, stomatin/prohibitin [Oscillatoria sp. FACHB-1407]